MARSHFIPAESFGQPRPESRRAGGMPTLDSADDAREPVQLGESLAVRQLRSQIRRIAPYVRIALIRGEIGSGKQSVARAIHALSPGADGPFLVIRAAGLAEALAGVGVTHSGSGSGSASAAAPLIESARGGTILLKGVGELSYGQQAGLMRFLTAIEELRSAPARNDCAGSGRLRFDHRILAASDRDLRTLAAIGQFRQDLYARLSAVEIVVPPLRQRVEDIPVLADWVLGRLAEESRQSPKLLAPATAAQLQQRVWSNNLRELRSVVAHAAALAEGALIEPRHLLALVEPGFAGPATGPAIRLERLQDVVEQHVLDVLTRCGGNKLRAAEVLGISRSTLYRMLDAISVKRAG